MFYLLGKKQPYSIKVAILVFAVFGAFVFSKFEILNYIGTTVNKYNSNGIFASINPAFDWLAEDTTITSENNRTSSQTQRNGILLSAETYEIEYLEIISLCAATYNYSTDFKNNIQINLRI